MICAYDVSVSKVKKLVDTSLDFKLEDVIKDGYSVGVADGADHDSLSKKSKCNYNIFNFTY